MTPSFQRAAGVLLIVLLVVLVCISATRRRDTPPATFNDTTTSTSSGNRAGVSPSSASFAQLGSTGPYTSSPNTYGGTYEISDKNACENLNVLTGYCGCPPFYSAITGGRVVNDNGPQFSIVGAYVITCSSNNGPLEGFGGSFQFDDSGPGSQGCRFKNSFTGACSCPQGFANITTDVIVDTAVPTQYISSHIVYCYSAAQPANATVFGGAFESDDEGHCVVGNPATGGNCSCAAGTKAQEMRVLTTLPNNGAYIGATIYTCAPIVDPLPLCEGIAVDPTGQVGADVAIQKCISRLAPGAVLELPLGNYRMTGQLVISKPLTLRTKGTFAAGRCSVSVQCARLLGSSEFNVPAGGLLFISNTYNVTIDHLIIDGNRQNRGASAAAQQCVAGLPRYGFNLVVSNCTNCTLINSQSINTLCGSSCEWRGAGAFIAENVFKANGDYFAAPTRSMWADGLTLLDGGNNTNRPTIVANNSFSDNSNIDFVCGGAAGALFTNNVITHQVQPAFAGMMWDKYVFDCRSIAHRLAD